MIDMKKTTTASSSPRARVVLGEREARTPFRAHPPLTLDIQLTVGADLSRLVACRDPATGAEQVVLMLGETFGAHDVPVQIVDEEALLIVGSRCAHTPLLLIGDSSVALTGNLAPRQYEVSRQLREGGPIRALLALSGAQSLVIDWIPAATAA
ncbi:hypothetical protein [Rhodococcus jostii]|nr:hypothetical protein [Rhodococcus jostii]